MDNELAKLRQLTKTLTSNGFLTDQTVAWKYAFDSVNELVCITNPSFKIKYLNKPFLAKLGSKPDDYINAHIEEIFNGDPFSEGDLVEMTDDTSFNFGESYIPELGGWYSKHKYLIQNNLKKIIGYTYMLTDVTERKIAEEELKESEARFKDLFMNMMSAAVVLRAVDGGKNFKIVNFNHATKEIMNSHNVPDDKVLGCLLTDIFPNAPNQPLYSKLKEVYETGESIRMPITYFKDERIRGYRENSIVQLPSKEIVLLSNDETAKVEAQEDLKENKELLEGVLNAIPDIISVQDGQSNVLAYNHAGLKFFNLTHKQIEGKKCYELMGRDIPCMDCQTKICKAIKAPAKLEKYIEELNGWYDCRSYPILDEDNEVTTVIEHLRDITELKREQKQKESYYRKMNHAFQRLHFIVTAVDGYIWEKEFSGPGEEMVHTYVDPAFCEDFYHIPVTKSESIDAHRACRKAFGRKGSELLNEYRETTGRKHTYGDLCISTDDHCIEQGKPCEYFEMGYIERDGGEMEWFIIRVRKTPIFNENGECTGVLGFANNCSNDAHSIKALITNGIKNGRIKKLETNTEEAKVYWVLERRKEDKTLTHIDFP